MQQLVLSTEWVSRFRRGVRRWYAAHGRKLPWVGQRDPYAVWVREIMLQQTTVTAVVPYLGRFLDRFPNVDVLASAEADEVLRAWEGLGYYSRARNLHKASRMIVEEWGGVWRETALELEALPGVGRYTAGAIASFAFDQPAAIVEANTARLFARLMALDSDLAQSASRRQLWSLAERVVPRVRPGEFNQALIDLGATVCGARALCQECPVRSCCRAFEHGLVQRIPRQAVRPDLTDLFELMLVIRRGSEVLLIQHAEGSRWGGLWGFPMLERTEEVECSGAEERRLRREAEARGCGVEFARWLPAFGHRVTRFRLHLQPVELLWQAGEWDAGVRAEWVPVDELASRPLSVAGRRVARAVQVGRPTAAGHSNEWDCRQQRVG